MRTFLEFFAGGGLARANWGPEAVVERNIKDLRVSDLPEHPDLAWASFPCQDLSHAGDRGGLDGGRSGTFWPFWGLMKGLRREGRGPRIIVVENVIGLLTANGGRDFAAVCGAMGAAHYNVGAVVVDAVDFLPQSRPRLFIIGVHNDISVPEALTSNGPARPFHPEALIRAANGVRLRSGSRWIWWQLPSPEAHELSLAEIIDRDPVGTRWHEPHQTKEMLTLMAPQDRKRLKSAMKSGVLTVGSLHRRMRDCPVQGRRQRAEVRFDGIAGCLRGSARQTIVVVEGKSVRSRLLTPREAARLMGLPESYQLPRGANDGHRLVGEGIAVPVVRHLAAHLFEPLLDANVDPGISAGMRISSPKRFVVPEAATEPEGQSANGLHELVPAGRGIKGNTVGTTLYL